MKIYFIFVILIHTSVKSISNNGKYCPLKEIFYTKENSMCLILPNENSTSDYEKKNKDWIDKYFTECLNDSFAAHSQTNSTILKSIACTDLVRKKDLMNISYIHHYNQKNDNRSTLRSMTVRKCCSQGQRYNTEIRECVNFYSNNFDVFYLLQNFFNETIYSLSIIQGPPICNYTLINYVISTVDVRMILHNDTYQSLIFSKADKNELFMSENNTCFDLGPSPDTLTVRTCSDANFCEKNTCLKKCCLEDEARINNKCQKLSLFPILKKRFHTEVESFINNTHYNTSLSDALKSTDYGLITGLISCKDNKGLFPVRPIENWYFTSNGNIYLPNHKIAYDHNNYCLEMILGSKFIEDGLYPIMCYNHHKIKLSDDYVPAKDLFTIRIPMKAISEMISCIFLLLTFLVYLSLPSLKNIHGLTLMCHIGSLFLAYSSHATIIFLTMYDKATEDYYLIESPICKYLGYTMITSFLATFSWLNIMCFDIWWTFRGFSSVIYINNENSTRRKRFLIYSCCAWGLPLLWSLIIFMIDSTDFIPENLRPHLGQNSCWLGPKEDSPSKVIYFYGPLSVILTVNVTFFILTLRNYNRVKDNISKFTTFTRNQRYELTKAKLQIILKLFIIMGISWIFEVVRFFMKVYATNLSWSITIFSIFDIPNCLHGMFIFFLFIVKTDVYRALIVKFGRKQANSRLIQRTNYLRNLFKNSRSVYSTCTLLNPTTSSTNSP